MKRSLTKVADLNKITEQSSDETKPYEVPTYCEVEEQEINEIEQCDGKGSISFYCQRK